MLVRQIDTRPSDLPLPERGAPEAFDPGAFDPHHPAHLADPYPTYARFREQAPVARVNPYETLWVFRFEDCMQVLNDTELWVKNPPGGVPPSPGPSAMMSRFPESLFSTDPPLHTQLRSLLEPLFKDSIEDAQGLAREIAASLLQTARKRGTLELVADYALPLPASVLLTVMGIPPGTHDQDIWKGLIAWQASIAAAYDVAAPIPVRQMGATCAMALNAFFEGMSLTEAQSSVKGVPAPAPGLFTEICRAFRDAGLSPQQVEICAYDFLAAGYLSTTYIVSLGVRNLLLHPDQLQKLRAEPSLVNSALEEMMRFDGAVHVLERCAATDTELGGQRFAPGDRVSVVIGSANRDPELCSEPDSFDITRAHTEHLGFGSGIHYCIGAPLARIVAPVALEMLLAEFSDLALDGEPQWQTDPHLRGLTSLTLSF